MSALAEGLVGSPDPEDDALVDLGEETVHAALFKEKDAPASPEPRRAVASLDLGPRSVKRTADKKYYLYNLKTRNKSSTFDISLS